MAGCPKIRERVNRHINTPGIGVTSAFGPLMSQSPLGIGIQRKECGDSQTARVSNPKGEQNVYAGVSRGHIKPEETSREIPRGNRGGLTLVKARTVPPAEWQG